MAVGLGTLSLFFSFSFLIFHSVLLLLLAHKLPRVGLRVSPLLSLPCITLRLSLLLFFLGDDERQTPIGETWLVSIINLFYLLIY